MDNNTGRLAIRNVFEHFIQFFLGFTLAVYEKIYLDANMKKPIHLTELILLYIGGVEIRLNFSSIPNHGSDITVSNYR